MKAIPRSPCSSAWKINTFLHVEADTAKGEVGIIWSNVLNHSKTLDSGQPERNSAQLSQSGWNHEQ